MESESAVSSGVVLSDRQSVSQRLSDGLLNDDFSSQSTASGSSRVSLGSDSQSLMVNGHFSQDDASQLYARNQQLRSQLQQTKMALDAEQSVAADLHSKLLEVQRAKTNAASKSNAELATVRHNCAKLRAELERGELARHTQSLQLAKFRRDATESKVQSTEENQAQQLLIEQLQSKLKTLALQAEGLQSSLVEEREAREAKEAELRLTVQEQSHQLSECKAELGFVISERNNLENQLDGANSRLQHLTSEHHELKTQCENLTASCQEYGAELDTLHEREGVLQNDVQNFEDKTLDLQNNLEQEKSAHLETKFKLEIQEVKLRDLQSNITAEKLSKDAIFETTNRLKEKLLECETLCEQEKKLRRAAEDHARKCEEKAAQDRSQYDNEIGQQHQVIESLSAQINLHEINFAELKLELEKAKTRQATIEEAYRNGLYKLESAIGVSFVKDKDLGALDVSSLFEHLLSNLSGYRARLEQGSQELIAVNQTISTLSKDNEKTQSLLHAKEKELVKVNETLVSTKQELHVSKHEMKDLEAANKKLKGETEKLNIELSSERQQLSLIQKDLQDISSQLQKSEILKLDFLRQQITNLHGFGEGTPGGHLSLQNWDSLASALDNLVARLLAKVQELEANVAHLDTIIVRKDELLTELETTSRNKVAELSTALNKKDRDHRISEEVYKNRINEAVNVYEEQIRLINKESEGELSRKCEEAKAAWEKLRVAGAMQQGIEAECNEMKGLLAKRQAELESCVVAVTLLLGAFIPLWSQKNRLSSQRSTYIGISNCYDTAKLHLRTIVDTLTSEMSDRKVRGRVHRPNGVFQFRIAVIAVLFWNRLLWLSRSNGVRSLILTPFGNLHLCFGQTSVSQVLSSTNILSGIQTSVSKLVEVTKSRDSVLLADKLAGSSLSCLLERLAQNFADPTTLTDPPYPQSLIMRLRYGLDRVMGHTALEGKLHLLSSSQLLASVNHHILAFTDRVRMSEIERQRVKKELLAATQDYDNQIETSQKRHQKEAASLRAQLNGMVGIGKFQTVCSELESALKREHEAQALLREQSEQLSELSARLGVLKQQDVEIERAKHDVHDAHSKLKSRERALLEQKQRIVQLEEERRRCSERASEADNVLAESSRGRATLLNYLRSLLEALEGCKHTLLMSPEKAEQHLSRVVLSTDLVPPQSDQSLFTQEFTACQELVKAFVTLYQHSNTHVASMQQQVDAQKRHIAALKTELSAAFRREGQLSELHTSSRF